MAFACPSCDHRLNLKVAKPGRYRPRCPKCNGQFALHVPEDNEAEYEIHSIGTPTESSRNRDRTLSNRAPVIASGVIPARGVGLDSGSAEGLRSPSNPFGLARTAPDLLEHRETQRPSRPQTSHSPPTPSNASALHDDEEDRDFAPPDTEVRGYRIEKELGRGGMGAVFLARQISLDRYVALKVMAKRWACDPTFVARFTREAYAAAQLSHPNIVQIHDIGEVDGARFFSMEYVPGRSLAEEVKADGKLDPETAVGYILQAARGLQHAHDRGMIHRDVKPDNLLLDERGLVKVADLGLVKTGSMELDVPSDRRAVTAEDLRAQAVGLTGARIALGTPAYMSPEQCRDAAGVDHRADIYSLGCTLYVLVTGRPPFDGTTAVELMTKQAYEPIVPPEQIVARMPAEISAVIQRMMAKDAADRFQNMADVIRTLEAWLGIRHTGTFSPREEQIGRLEAYALAFDTAPAAVQRRRLTFGFTTSTLVLAVLLLFFGHAAWAAGLIGLLGQVSLAYFAVQGMIRKGPLFTRARQFAFGLRWADWGLATAGGGLFAILLASTGTLWIWSGFGFLAVGIAIAVGLWLDRRIDAQRRVPLAACERMLRKLRESGLDEGELRHFVAKFAGRRWEEFFEALFGFEAKMTARASLTRGGSLGQREKYAAWREPLLEAIARIEKSRRDARERKLLAAVESARLEAEGHSREEAATAALARAEAMVRGANSIRRAEKERAQSGQASRTGSTAPTNVAQSVGLATNADFAFEPDRPDRLARIIGHFVGPRVRAVLASILLAGFALWAYQNGFVPSTEIGAKVVDEIEAKHLAGFADSAIPNTGRVARPLQLDRVPARLTAWVDGLNVGVAGLLLMGSLFFRGNAMSAFVIAGAAITAAGHHFGIRTVEPIRDYQVALLLGSILAAIGLRMGSR